MGKRLSKIYTRTGDNGETGLGDGSRVHKTDPRIAAMGTVDELNACVGIVVAGLQAARAIDHNEALAPVATFLEQCQHRIFDLGGEISIPRYELLAQRHVDAIEQHLDELNAGLPPLANFILPGGSPLIAQCHLARSVCRRAERDLLALAANEPVNIAGVRYLNRLSDYLFVAARFIARETGVQEVLWRQDASQDIT